MWFEQLMGFKEKSPQQVRENISVEGDLMTSKINKKSFICGKLETPSLAELRERVRETGASTGANSVREIVADVQNLHENEAHAGSLFQVASQFNLLEMPEPYVTPERGVGIYENDRTQGPACAVAAGAGTIYRNYFVPVNGQIGQTKECQIDCLSDLATALGGAQKPLWEMQNGYALASHEGLVQISNRLNASNENERDELRQLLRIGIHWNTQVTLKNAQHQVSQAYCSALPVAYSNLPKDLWSGFAKLILEAAYEATLCAAILNASQTGNNRLFLTWLGGGAFGNKNEWITSAIQRALNLYRHANLEIVLVSYGSTNPSAQGLID